MKYFQKGSPRKGGPFLKEKQVQHHFGALGQRPFFNLFRKEKPV